ncbi:MAG: hypothetical protein AB7O67_12370 [Vicinamibacterales bacterium]
MANFMAWLTRGQCLVHAEPIYDRDETGAIFRCPRCLHTWPRLHTPQEPALREIGAYETPRREPQVADVRGHVTVRGHVAAANA